MEIFVIFGMPVIMIIAIVLFRTFERHERYKLQADLYAKALEKGQPVPTVPNNWFADPPQKSNSLKVGFICMAVGVAILFIAWLVFVGATMLLTGGEFEHVRDVLRPLTLFGLIGVLPLMIGFAFVGIHFFEKKKDAVKHAE
jgi:hypothetical protein